MVGALLAGLVADGAGAVAAISVVAGLTGASGIVVAATRWRRAAATSVAPAGPAGASCP